MPLEIPLEHVKALVAISRLSSAEFSKLAEVLRQEPPSASPSKVANRITERFKAAGFPNPDEMSGAIREMFRTRQRFDGLEGPSRFVDGVLDAIKAKGGESSLDSDEAAKLGDRITSLTGSDSPLARSYKAIGVLVSHQKIYQDARILTDIRPVFYDDLNRPFDEVVTVHNLDLTYQEDDDIKHVYVALDADDLKALKQVIERAILKDEAVQARLGSLNLHISTPEHSE